ncbi:hypothetical protein OFY17_08710 [Marinomonas sp. C2222]|uniref:LacI family transcriptional regulator n=1 Tax=Marinomonas sargassi TaxID=2984494 RepID=A0ABT2YTM7_9GAMM|nr:hypothetical protein [Marinomonas sargassi]MCV2402959.1 hypothetical protein [Marinomonas sargassi]
MTKINSLKNNYPTIAILTNTMATPFTEGIIFGAADFAKQHNYNILCFSGSKFAKHTPTDMSRHRIFELIDLDLIDGIIIPIGSLSRFISREEHASFLSKFSGIPIITINSDVPGYIDIGFSAQKGMFDLVAHLHNDHSVRRFAFAGITGTHRSTQLKKQSFIDALQDHNIKFDEKFLITSAMYRNAPLDGLEELFNCKRNSWPQAIVSATSSIAKDIISKLSLQNIRAPKM